VQREHRIRVTGGATAHWTAYGRQVLWQIGRVVVRDMHGRAAGLDDHFVRLDDEIREVLAPDDLTRPAGADIDDSEVRAPRIRHDERVLVPAECVARPKRDSPRLPAGRRDTARNARWVGHLG